SNEALPGAQREVNSIAQNFKGTFYSGSQATEHNFKKEASQFSMIHLATHGISDRATAARSHLLFTHSVEDSIEDNILFAYEISNLHLPADLVVLSGCETGYGSVTKGEGVMSSGRNFIYAGSKSVLLTLWKISDETSA